MGKKYDVHDNDGNRIGSIEQVPSGADTIVGAAILFHLLAPALPYLFAGMVILALIVGALGVLGWIGMSAKEAITPYSEISIQAKGELGGGENDWGWTIYYVIRNNSAVTLDINLNAKLPVTFSSCQAAGQTPTLVNFQTLSSEPVVVHVSVPPNRSISGTAYATYSEGAGRTKGYYMCWQTAGCDSYYGCQDYQIGVPIFNIERGTLPPLSVAVEQLP